MLEIMSVREGHEFILPLASSFRKYMIVSIDRDPPKWAFPPYPCPHPHISSLLHYLSTLKLTSFPSSSISEDK